MQKSKVNKWSLTVYDGSVLSFCLTTEPCNQKTSLGGFRPWFHKYKGYDVAVVFFLSHFIDLLQICFFRCVVMFDIVQAEANMLDGKSIYYIFF